MFLIFSGPVGLILILLLLMFQERPERPVFRKLPRNIPPAKNHTHEWEAEMIKARRSLTLKSSDPSPYKRFKDALGYR